MTSRMFKIYLAVIVVSSIIQTFATATAIEAIYINQTYGGLKADGARSVVQTVDGGYALAGSTESFGVGSVDFWLVKVDAGGNHVWNQTYGGSERTYASSVVQTVDGGFALAGSKSSFWTGKSDFWLVKTDQNGFIPEFPIWTLILLVGILLSVIIFTVIITIYRRKLFTTTNH